MTIMDGQLPMKNSYLSHPLNNLGQNRWQRPFIVTVSKGATETVPVQGSKSPVTLDVNVQDLKRNAIGQNTLHNLMTAVRSLVRMKVTDAHVVTMAHSAS